MHRLTISAVCLALLPLCATAQQVVPDPPTVSATGRTSNETYDVVIFGLSLNVEADAVETFLLELTRDRFFTVTQLDINTVDAAAEAQAGYIYGDKPVVRLNMQVEALFLRSWTTPLMPPAVKTQLGVGVPKPAAPEPEKTE